MNQMWRWSIIIWIINSKKTENNRRMVGVMLIIFFFNTPRPDKYVNIPVGTYYKESKKLFHFINHGIDIHAGTHRGKNNNIILAYGVSIQFLFQNQVE